ncbi:DUF6525 family protein [uncultured Paraglaciecola sp.]|uniref:DUF6525 family protein n=1 Tax=uncultured Paraglaciecola sp. TaxID=1765024 RepID=UPI0026373600|nr:DUF6525 family protein [uncultured Paraglaciecola sp.]
MRERHTNVGAINPDDDTSVFVEGGAAQEMRAFDRLPKEFRDWLNSTPQVYSAAQVCDMIDTNGYKETLDALRRLHP